MAVTPPGADTFTAIHFVLIGLLFVATLLLIAAGVRRARARRAAERQVRDESLEAGAPVLAAAPPPPELRAVPPEGQTLDRTPLAPEFDARPLPDPTPDPAASVVGAAPVVDEAPPERPIADERIAPAAPMAASPATVADPAPAEPVPFAPPPAAPSPAAPPTVGGESPADGPITQLKGLGPKVAARLAQMGVTTVGQIAALDADQANELDAGLGPFAGRLHRDRWIEQARFLAAGDRAGFEAVFGKL